MLRHTMSISAIILCFACAGANIQANEAGLSSRQSVAPQGDHDTITSEEMLAAPGLNNLYEVVQRLHPEWLVQRPSISRARDEAGRAEREQISVYTDDQRTGNVEFLKNMSIRGVKALKFYSASTAQAKFGTGDMTSAIQVVMR